MDRSHTAVSFMSMRTPSPVIQYDAAPPMFYVVSLRKLIILNFFTGGLYWLYWFFRNWDLYRRYRGSELLFLSGVVWPEFFIYVLLNRVDRRIRVTGRRFVWSPWWLAFAMVLMLALFGTLRLVTVPFPDSGPLALAFVVTGVLHYLTLCRVQQAINYCEGDVRGEGNARLSWANWLWIVVFTWGGLMLDGALPDGN